MSQVKQINVVRVGIEIFVIVAAYWLGYQSAMFNVAMNGKPVSPFSTVVEMDRE